MALYVLVILWHKVSYYSSQVVAHLHREQSRIKAASRPIIVVQPPSLAQLMLSTWMEDFVTRW